MTPLQFLAVLVALLVGLAAGKAWERYKLRDGRWIDRRRARDSPHYMLGLNFLVANQIDPAIEELSRAADSLGDPLEIRLILGNLYREKGQVGRAIQEHQALLQRPHLRKLEHANVLLCLGLDYRRGGFIDRATEAFSEVLRLDPGNGYALANLEKIHEEQHHWADAYAARKELASGEAAGTQARHHEILAFLENEIGQEALKAGDARDAAARFEAAIELDEANVPAHLNLGDVRLAAGDRDGARTAWEQLITRAPDRAFLAFDRLEHLYGQSDPGRFPALCRRIIAERPHDWRARLALAQHLRTHGAAREAADLLLDALASNPHGLMLHQAIWQTLAELDLPPNLVDRYRALARDLIFYRDPHVCVRCRYRSTELLWQCPHCHEWNTFIEERVSEGEGASGKG
jgi:lipopolysaccharide assembly protein B